MLEAGGFVAGDSVRTVLAVIDGGPAHSLPKHNALYVLEIWSPLADYPQHAAAVAGILGTLGLIRFYQELAGGRMGIIAPATAVVTVTIPVLFSAITEGLPQANQIAGIFLAIAAIWLITRSGSQAAITPRDIASILLMGFLFSIFLVTIGTVSERSIIWPLVASRTASIALVIAILYRRTEVPALKPLNGEALSAAASVLDVRVVEFEAFIKTFALVI